MNKEKSRKESIIFTICFVTFESVLSLKIRIYVGSLVCVASGLTPLACFYLITVCSDLQ